MKLSGGKSNPLSLSQGFVIGTVLQMLRARKESHRRDSGTGQPWERMCFSPDSKMSCQYGLISRNYKNAIAWALIVENYLSYSRTLSGG